VPVAFDPLGLAARLAVGLVLVVSGTFKAASPPEEFALIISSYQLQFVSTDLARTLAVFLPWLELLVGYALVLGYLKREATLAAAGLFCCFIGALLSIKLRGINLPNCGCFGVGGFHPSPTATLIMDTVLLAACWLAFTRGRTPPSLDNWAEGSYT
jgi:uncharacterized membrane protein YphA (DoxX/SURF4 family)